MNQNSIEQIPFSLRWLVGLAAFVVLVAGLKVAAPLLAQFLLALFIAVVCSPAIDWLTRRKVPHSLAVIAVLLVFLLFVYLIVFLVGDSVQSFRQNQAFYIGKFQTILAGASNWLVERGLPAENLQLDVILQKADVMGLVSRVLGGVTTIFSQFFIIFLSVIFILAEMTGFHNKFALAFANSQEKMVHIDKVLQKIRHYLAIKTMASLLTGALVSILLVIIGVDYPFLWGMLAFLLNYIPNIGSIIAAIPAVILALVQLGPAAMVWTLLSFFAVNNLVGNYLEPKWMGKLLGLSAFVVFVSLIFWGYVFGSVGMFLSVPLTMAIKIILEASPSTRWVAIMLGPEPEEQLLEKNNGIQT